MLLRVIESGGYPFEYLLARIAIRRGNLIADWQPMLNAADPLAAIPAGTWRTRPEDRSAEDMSTCGRVCSAGGHWMSAREIRPVFDLVRAEDTHPLP
jgi:hypothetical protein